MGSIAEKYQRLGLELDDLRSEGVIGLILAINKARADKMKNSRFASYAASWITQIIRIAVREQGNVVRRPQRQFERALKFAKNNDMSGIEEEEKEELIRLVKTPLSLNQRVRTQEEDYGEDPAEFIELLPDSRVGIEELTIEADCQLKLKEALQELFRKRLSKRERLVISLRFEEEEPKTLQEIAEILELSKERVRQIEKKAKEKLRKCAFLFEAKVCS